MTDLTSTILRNARTLSGHELDTLAGFYEIKRNAGETDDKFRCRAVAEIHGTPMVLDVEPSPWQPIETAPHGDEENGPFFDVIWVGRMHRYLPVQVREIDCFRSGSIIKRLHGYPSVLTIYDPQPTHWMPSPPIVQP